MSDHFLSHIAVMAELHKLGRYDRMLVNFLKLTGKTPATLHDFLKLHAPGAVSCGTYSRVPLPL